MASSSHSQASNNGNEHSEHVYTVTSVLYDSPGTKEILHTTNKQVGVGQPLQLESLLYGWTWAGGYIYSGGRLVDAPVEITFQSLQCMEVSLAGSHAGTLALYSECTD